MRHIRTTVKALIGATVMTGGLIVVTPAAQAITIPVACSENALVAAVNRANSTPHLGHPRVGGRLYIWHDHQPRWRPRTRYR